MNRYRIPMSGISALQEYVRIARYAGFNEKEKRRETWEEQINRVMDKMHAVKYAKQLKPSMDGNSEFASIFEEARRGMLEKRVLGSQRALQFAGKCIDKNCRIYNCAATYVDRPEVFGEIMWILLCGSGIGISVQQHHVEKLPEVYKRGENTIVYEIPDTIEGWADSISVLLYSYFRGIKKNDKLEEHKKKMKIPVQNMNFNRYSGSKILFDFSRIRKKGAPISGITGKAPGPEPLMAALNKIETIIERRLQEADTTVTSPCLPHAKLRPIDVFDIVMHSSDAVLSAGVRRSAILTMFTPEDEEMMKAKTGNWYIENPQRGRSNNSAVLLRNKVKESEFAAIFESTKQFGEPGFIWTDSTEFLFNPCVEVGLYGYDEAGRSGVQFCNLTEINMGAVKSEADFLDSCRVGSIIGTMQAGYTDFDYLGPITEAIVRREALLGVSMTGMCDNPKFAFDAKLLTRGAEIVVETNEYVAKLIGINPAARTTCVKPAGTSTLLLGLSGSGIHPAHARQYIRRVQENKTAVPVKFYKQENPRAVKDSSWSNNQTDYVISFPIEIPADALTKADLSAIQFLDMVKMVQMHWVNPGKNKKYCVDERIHHNVSNTVLVRPDEWDAVAAHIYKNRQYYAGISLLADSGDKDYIEAPFQEVLTPEKISAKYGPAAFFASGLLVHAEEEFGNLYKACDSLLGIGENPIDDSTKMRSLLEKKYSDTSEPTKQLKKKRKRYVDENEPTIEILKKTTEKGIWILRAKNFARKYFGGNLKQMTYCMKDVDALKKWVDINDNHTAIDWTQLRESEDVTGFIGDVACGGDKCSIII